MTEQRQAARKPWQLSLPLRWLLSVQLVLVMAYPVLLLGIASLFSFGVIIRQFSEPSGEILALLPIAGGWWGVIAMAAMLFNTLLKPDPFYSADYCGLCAGSVSCLAVIGVGYDSLFIWLMFSLPILAALELLWLRRHTRATHCE